jgi:hypothetical protein
MKVTRVKKSRQDGKRPTGKKSKIYLLSVSALSVRMALAKGGVAFLPSLFPRCNALIVFVGAGVPVSTTHAPHAALVEGFFRAVFCIGHLYFPYARDVLLEKMYYLRKWLFEKGVPAEMLHERCQLARVTAPDGVNERNRPKK